MGLTYYFVCMYTVFDGSPESAALGKLKDDLNAGHCFKILNAMKEISSRLDRKQRDATVHRIQYYRRKSRIK